MPRLSKKAPTEVEFVKHILASSIQLLVAEAERLERATIKLDDSKRKLELHAQGESLSRLFVVSDNAEDLFRVTMNDIFNRVTASAIGEARSKCADVVSDCQAPASSQTTATSKTPSRLRRATETIGVTAPRSLWDAVLTDICEQRGAKASAIRTLLREGLDRFDRRRRSENTKVVWSEMQSCLQDFDGKGKQRMARMDETLYCQIVVGAHEFGVSASSFAAMCIAFGLTRRSVEDSAPTHKD